MGILKGAKEGKLIAWRAHINAMPSEIADIVDFKSENEGVQGLFCYFCGLNLKLQS